MLNKIRIIFGSILLNLLSKIVPTSDSIVCFGSWIGDSYNDNPKYLFEYILDQDTDLKLYWIGKKKVEKEIPENSKCQFLRKDSIKANVILLRAKYCVFCQGTSDLSEYNFLRKKITIFTDHGLTVKKWGSDSVKNESNQNGRIKRRFLTIYRKLSLSEIFYSYILISSDDAEGFYKSALRENINSNTKIIKTGTPRNDFLIKATNENITFTKDKITNKLGINSDVKIILYAPTYRRSSSDAFSFLTFDEEEMKTLNNFLYRENAIIIEKNHYVTSKIKGDTTIEEGNIIHLGKNITLDFQELLLISDVLVSDFSGSIFDFLCLERPIIMFCYDYISYKDYDSGLYYTIDQFTCGSVCYTNSELLMNIYNVFDNASNYIVNRKIMKNRFIKYEKGIASKQVLDLIMRENHE